MILSVRGRQNMLHGDKSPQRSYPKSILGGGNVLFGPRAAVTARTAVHPAAWTLPVLVDVVAGGVIIDALSQNRRNHQQENDSEIPHLPFFPPLPPLLPFLQPIVSSNKKGDRPDPPRFPIPLKTGTPDNPSLVFHAIPHLDGNVKGNLHNSCQLPPWNRKKTG